MYIYIGIYIYIYPELSTSSFFPLLFRPPDTPETGLRCHYTLPVKPVDWRWSAACWNFGQPVEPGRGAAIGVVSPWTLNGQPISIDKPHESVNTIQWRVLGSRRSFRWVSNRFLAFAWGAIWSYYCKNFPTICAMAKSWIASGLRPPRDEAGMCSCFTTNWAMPYPETSAMFCWDFALEFNCERRINLSPRRPTYCGGVQKGCYCCECLACLDVCQIDAWWSQVAMWLWGDLINLFTPWRFTHDLVDYRLARVTVDQRELAVCHGISKVYFRPCDSTSAESGVVASPDKRREILMTKMDMCQWSLSQWNSQKLGR